MISGEIGIGETCWPEKGEEDMASGLRELSLVELQTLSLLA